MMSFKIDVHSYERTKPKLTINLIGHFSIDGNSEYRADLSQMKYYIPPPNLNNVNFDLSKNFESTHHKSTSHIKLDHILRWVSDNFDRLEKPLSVQEKRWLDFDFICSRGAIKTILSSPHIYYKQNEWIICASKYRGTIYFCKFYTNEKEHDHFTPTLSEKQMTSQGHKFEQYMLADDPSHTPNPERSLNECEEFHCMFKAKFDKYSLLYGAEIDGISSKQPIKDTLIDKSYELIELKTVFMHKTGNMKRQINSEKISTCWSQCYLTNINRIIFGLKDRDKKVIQLKEFSLQDLPKLSKQYCNVDEGKIFCKIFLDNVRRIVTKDHNEYLYKFHWRPIAKNVVNYSEEAPDREVRFFFLQPWFVDKAEEYRRRSQ